MKRISRSGGLSRRLRAVRAIAALVSVGCAYLLQAQEPATQEGRLANVDAIMEHAVTSGTIPGGVVLIGHSGKVIYRKAFGERSLEPMREAMTVDTIFDLA